MNKYFTYNFTEKEIIGSKAAINRANRGMNPEYTELTRMLAEHPTFSVKVKEIQKKEGKKTYSALTINRMREYFSIQTDSTKKLIEFEAVMKVAEAKGAKYPLTKKWFLSTFSEYKDTDISETETQQLIKDAEKAA